MQAEACLSAYFEQSKNFEILAENLQIHTTLNDIQNKAGQLNNPKARKTLGELDYIVKNHKTQKIIHIELACKFYLFDEKAGETKAEKWIGPNRKDSLFDKLEKIKTKQFPFLYIPETIQKLIKLGIPIPTSQELCLKAFLFLPKKMPAEKFSKNFHHCIVGHYIKPKDLEQDETAIYAIPTKKEWLLPTERIADWHSFTEIKKAIETQIEMHKSPLIYKKTPYKLERFFVVWW